MIEVPKQNPATYSLGQILALSSEDEQEAFFADLEAQGENAVLDFLYDWKVWGRPSQHEPQGLWTTWVICCGRGFGKTRCDSEHAHMWAKTHPGCRIALVAPTAADVRDVLVEGESGIMSTFDPRFEPLWEPTKRRITWPNGSIATTFSADEPDRFRGPQHHFAIIDELAAYPKADDVLKMVRLGLRLKSRFGWPRGFRPRMLITTTPRPIPVMRKLLGIKPYKADPRVYITLGSTYENAANLDDEFLADITKDLGGTRIGRQEIDGVVLEDVPGALWKIAMIDPYRVSADQLPDDWRGSCVAVDPAATASTTSNTTGIIVCAVGPPPSDFDQEVDEPHDKVNRSLKRSFDRLHGYVIHDGSIKGTPDAWARAAVRLYHEYECDYIVAEANQGGDMVAHTIRSVDAGVPIRLVHATKNKQTRAEPIVALYEQKRVHHVGVQSDLEDEMCTWDPEIERKSPDRVDALVWGLHSLMVKRRDRPYVEPIEINKRKNPWEMYPTSGDAAF